MRNNVPSHKSYPTSDDYVDPDGFGPDPALDESQVMRPLIHQSQVLPYRGQEYHGVNPDVAGPPPDINADVFDQTAVVAEPQRKSADEPRAVPVRIVKADDEWEQTLFRTYQHVVGSNPVRVANHHKTRSTLQIKNDGTVGIYVSAEVNPNVVNSWLLPAGSPLTIGGINAVYAVSVDGSNQPVSVYMEYSVTAKREAQS